MTSRDEFEKEKKRKNYTRAVTIAEDEGLDSESLESARDLAFKQSVGEWFNFRGAAALAQEWGFGSERVRRLCDELVTEFQDREKKEGRTIQVFDIERMDHTHVIKLVTQFRDKY